MAAALSTLSVAVGVFQITVWGIVSVEMILSLGQNVSFGASVSIRREYNVSSEKLMATP